MSVRHLDRLFEPRSIAVIGASNRPSSVGATVWRNDRAGSFLGAIVPVNPKHATLDGFVVVRRVSELPEPPDLTVLCAPPKTVAKLIQELGQLGTRAAIFMTAGADVCAKAGGSRRPTTSPTSHPRPELPGPAVTMHRPHASFAHIMGRGTQRMTAKVLRENKAIGELAGRYGFQVDAAASAGTSLRFVLDSGAPRTLSNMR